MHLTFYNLFGLILSDCVYIKLITSTTQKDTSDISLKLVPSKSTG